MAPVKDPMGGISPNAPIVTAVVIHASDVESQPWLREHTAVEEVEGERDGMGAGTAAFVLILMSIRGSIIGTIYAALYPVIDADNSSDVYITPALVMILAVVSGGCVFAAAVVVASFLTCGCCCLGRYELKTRVNARAEATLVTLCHVLAFTNRRPIIPCQVDRGTCRVLRDRIGPPDSGTRRRTSILSWRPWMGCVTRLVDEMLRRFFIGH
jgi:hypothetical protein